MRLGKLAVVVERYGIWKPTHLHKHRVLWLLLAAIMKLGECVNSHLLSRIASMCKTKTLIAMT